MARKPKSEKPRVDKSTARTTEREPIKLSDHQKAAIEIYDKSDILFLRGQAGTGKTYVAMLLACRDLRMGLRERILCVRPVVQAGEDLGFLPGNKDEKIAPYMTPLFDSIRDLSSSLDDERELRSRVETNALAYMRGVTFVNTVAILDEAQNCTLEQIVLFLTRIGRNSKLVLTGDPSQCDRPDSENVFRRVSTVLGTVPRVGLVDIPPAATVRHNIITPLLKQLEQL